MHCALFHTLRDKAMMIREGVTLVREPPGQVAAFEKPRRLRLVGLGRSLLHTSLGVSGMSLNHGLSFVVYKMEIREVIILGVKRKQVHHFPSA